jgi:hypothetical protein
LDIGPGGGFESPEAARDTDCRLYLTGSYGSHVVLEHPRPVRWSLVTGRQVAFVRPAAESWLTVHCVDEVGAGVRSLVSVRRRIGRNAMEVLHVPVDASGASRVALHGEGAFVAELLDVSTRASTPRVRPTVEFEATHGSSPSVTFLVPRPAEVDVLVLDEDGRPLPSVVVSLKTKEDGVFVLHPDGACSAADGRVPFRGVAPGEAILQTMAFGREFLTRRIVLGHGPRTESFWLRPGGHVVRGRLTGVPGDRPFADVGTHLLRVSGETSGIAAFLSIQLDASGSFVVPGVPSGRYDLKFAPIAALTQRERVMVSFEVGGGDVDLGEIDLAGPLRAGPAIAELVVSSEGGLRKPFLRYRNEGWPSMVWRVRQVGLLEQGTPVNVFGALTPGRYTFGFSFAETDPDAFDVTGTVQLTVVEGDGHTVPRATLRSARR